MLSFAVGALTDDLLFNRPGFIHMKRLILFSLFATVLFHVQAQEQSDAPEGTLTPASVKERFEQKIASQEEIFLSEAKKLQSSYLAALIKAESVAKSLSDLDLILAIRKEILRVESDTEKINVKLSGQETLASLQTTWNENISDLRKDKQKKHRALSLRVSSYANQQIKPSIQAGDIDGAVAWRDLSTWITEQTPEEVIEDREEENPTHATLPLHTLTIWNQHNGPHNDRGTTKLSIEVLYKGKTVWEKKETKVNWKKSTDSYNTFNFHTLAVDQIKVTIDDFHDLGGGLAEIILEVNQQVKKPKSVVASAQYGGLKEKRFSPENAIDGITTSETSHEGYWLLPTGQKGWIQITY